MGADHARLPRPVLTQVVVLAVAGAVVVVAALAIEQRASLWSAVPAAASLGLLAGLVLVRFRLLSSASPEPVAVPGETPRVARHYLVPTELPPAPDVFVGRHAEIARMLEVLATARAGGWGPRLTPVILITGRAGIGKTATALHFAYQVDARYPDGQLFGRRDMAAPGGGWEAVLRAFVGALLGPGDDRPTDRAVLAREFARLTRDRRVLAVLDDVRDGDDVSDLIPSGRACVAVITSRGTLVGQRADLRIDLPPLEQAASVELLDRLVGDDRVSRAAGAAEMIVRGAGNVPLGVTLSGATLAGRPHWDLQLVVRRLRQRSGDTVDALDLAYELLTNDEQRALVCLGLLARPVFAPWELAACMRTGEADAWTIVERLSQAGLVERTAADASGVSRFHVLDRVYEYADARAARELSPQQRAEIQERYQSALRERHRRSAADGLHRRIYRIKDAGRLNEALDLVRSALALAQDNHDLPALDLAVATLAEINAELGNTADGPGPIAPPAHREGTRMLAWVRSLRYSGLTLRRQFRIDEALRKLTDSLTALDDVDLPEQVRRNERVRTLRERAIAHAFGTTPLDGLGDIELIEALLSGDDELESHHRAGVAWAVGAIYDYADQHVPAEVAMRQGLAAARDNQQELWSAWLLHGTARLALDIGETGRCRTEAGSALQLFARMQHRYGTAHCRLLIGRAHARDGALPAASSALEETVETLSACDDIHLVAVTTAELAGVRVRQHRPAEARRLFEAAERVMNSLGDQQESMLIRQQLEDLRSGPAIEVPPATAP
ncbi:NB-ARC domain-containing protein [Actinoplanes sp. NPDC048796]|uniref:NB-ARC domain-containing protein n=1 Tax=Actinoplanes sp. NPDC048796 TaxID=3155640 RepID=UPI00341143CE